MTTPSIVAIVRKALRNRGVSNALIYTNVYKQCKTVKTYSMDPVTDEAIIRDMELLTQMIPGLTVKVLPSRNVVRRCPDSIIIRLPR